jgi:hypothetical protein
VIPKRKNKQIKLKTLFSFAMILYAVLIDLKFPSEQQISDFFIQIIIRIAFITITNTTGPELVEEQSILDNMKNTLFVVYF